MKYETILLHHSAGIDLFFFCAGGGGHVATLKKLLKSAQQQSKIIRATQPNPTEIFVLLSEIIGIAIIVRKQF